MHDPRDMGSSMILQVTHFVDSGHRCDIMQAAACIQYVMYTASHSQNTIKDSLCRVC